MKRLVLEIEVLDYETAEFQEIADQYYEGNIKELVLEEMKPEVVLGLASLAGEKNMTDDWQLYALNGIIRGARIVESDKP